MIRMKIDLQMSEVDIGTWRNSFEEVLGLHVDDFDDADYGGDGASDVDEIPQTYQMSKNSVNRRRFGISAQPLDPSKPGFKPPKYMKSESQARRLLRVLETCVFFKDLDEDGLDVLVSAMREREFKEGHRIVQEGHEGEHLFIVEKGQLDVLKVNRKTGIEKYVKSLGPGDVFGELALLYGTPRAASVQVWEDSVLWELDRQTFSWVVKASAYNRSLKYESFLSQVPLLRDALSKAEISALVDAMQVETYVDGDQVIREGDIGDKFFIVLSGRAHGIKGHLGLDEREVARYKAGDYFGELALLKNEPRAASVFAISDELKLLTLHRSDFKRLLGEVFKKVDTSRYDWRSNKRKSKDPSGHRH